MKYRNLFFAALVVAYVHGTLAAVGHMLRLMSWAHFGMAVAIFAGVSAVVLFIIAANSQSEAIDREELRRIREEKAADKDKDVEIAQLRAKTAADEKATWQLHKEVALRQAAAQGEVDEKLRQVRAWLNSNDDRDDLEALARIVGRK